MRTRPPTHPGALMREDVLPSLAGQPVASFACALGVSRVRPLLFTIPVAAVLLTQSGCMGVAELAYDSAAGFERAQCEKLVAMSDRKACLERVNTAVKQAQTQRNRP